MNEDAHGSVAHLQAEIKRLKDLLQKGHIPVDDAPQGKVIHFDT